jgi:hypothetical protein
MNGQLPLKTILILSANPRGTESLRLDEEAREIKAGIQRSRHRDRFVIEYQLAARPRDVLRAMLDYKPQIVHFCGHGAGNNGLVLEDDQGKIEIVSSTALAALFELFANHVECVLLNACYSEIQAKAIANHINYVIGMNQAIGDRAAIEFATSFYDALGAGSTVTFAFQFGKNSIQFVDIPEEQVPVLLQKPCWAERTAASDSTAPYTTQVTSPTTQATSRAVPAQPMLLETKEVPRANINSTNRHFSR